MFKKIATLAVAAVALTAVATSAVAKPKINPVAAGLVGAAIVGTAIVASQQPAYGHYPHKHCYWKPHYNVFGQIHHYDRVCYWH